MIAISWISYEGTKVDESRTEYRNGILCHAVDTGLPVAKAVNYSDNESNTMWQRALDYVASDMQDKDHVTVCKCRTLAEAKSKALAKV